MIKKIDKSLVFCIVMGVLLGFLPELLIGSAQPIPRQEQNTRLIHALEKVATSYQANAHATEANTRAMQELTRAVRQSKNPQKW